MKPLGKDSRRRNVAALTLIEVLVTIFVIVILLGLFLPMLARDHRKSSLIRCVSNLKQVGLAFRMWPGDSDKFVMCYPTNQGGTLEVANEVWRSFQAMSNELSDPRILICPMDKTRVATESWTNNFNNGNISYFIGLDAREELPNTVLSGDRNLTNGQPLQNQVMSISSETPVGWTGEMHNHQGNVGLADGSVQQLSATALRKQVETALADVYQYSRKPGTNNLLRLALP